MITTLAVSNYRSLLRLVLPLGTLNVVSGPNGSGKSNLYRALRLLSLTASGGVVNALATEGGLSSTFWAGPEEISRAMKMGAVPVQGGPRRKPAQLKLGFTDQNFGYAITLGLPASSGSDYPRPSRFRLDPEIKRECIWAGPVYRAASVLVDRKGPLARVRTGRTWHVVSTNLTTWDSIFSQLADPNGAPEVISLRDQINGWRFYDHFRTDPGAPTRLSRLGTRTPVLHHDGRDLAAALQTIREIGDHEALEQAVSDAFPGSALEIDVQSDQRFTVRLQQAGLLRSLSCEELSDGTLRYLLWVAALLTPRPPPLMVLNEPETSLHPDLLPALGRLIAQAAQRCQVWVVTHSDTLISALREHVESNAIALHKTLGQTCVSGLESLDEPPWRWPGTR